MRVIKIQVNEIVSVDGSKRYQPIAYIQVGKYLGVIPKIKKYGLLKISMDAYFLSKETFWSYFKTLGEARYNIEVAVNYHISEYEREKVKKINKIRV